MGRERVPALARVGRPPTGYASGANNRRRVMAEAPLSIATRQPYRTGPGRATGIPRSGGRSGTSAPASAPVSLTDAVPGS